MKLSPLIIPTALILLLLSSGANAAEKGNITSATSELALLGGYGTSMPGYGETKTEVQTVDLVLRYGHFLSEEKGKGNWYQGRHELFVELPYHLAIHHGSRSMAGANLLGSWKFTGAESFTPYLLWGGGVVYVDLGLPTMGSRWNGNYQAGGGIQHFISRNLAFTGEYRFHHISNMNTSHPNEPLNSSKLLFGITLYR